MHYYTLFLNVPRGGGPWVYRIFLDIDFAHARDTLYIEYIWKTALCIFMVQTFESCVSRKHLAHIYGLMNSAMCLFQMDLPPWHTKSIWRHLTHVTNLHSITSWLCRQPDHWSLTSYAHCISSSPPFCTESKEWYLGQNQTGHSIPGVHQEQVQDTRIRDGL